ncbi:unnamed protein product, partial [Prorocentrum cordatum]
AEVQLKNLSPAERQLFVESDAKEWSAMTATGAARVLSPDESPLARRRHPDRILSSRMVRRFKPSEGVGSMPTAKSRWRVHGHQDPGGESLQVYAPTPQSETIMVALQVIAAIGWELGIADAKNAFCQSNRLDRPKGAFYVEACAGLNLPPETLIELVAPVCGLNDAPLLWHRTLAGYLEELGFVRSLLEPCLWLQRSASGKLQALILIEVDDLIVSGDKVVLAALKESLFARFKFGKWEVGEADYAGRHVKQVGSKITVDQEKYIREQLSSIVIPKDRRSKPEELLTSSEIASYRATVAQIQWLARESRPDLAGSASLLAAALPSPSIEEALMANKVVKFLRAFASQYITIWNLDPLSTAFVTASDAGGPGSARRGGAQAGWLVFAADAAIPQNHRARELKPQELQALSRVCSGALGGPNRPRDAGCEASREELRSYCMALSAATSEGTRRGGHPADYAPPAPALPPAFHAAAQQIDGEPCLLRARPHALSPPYLEELSYSGRWASPLAGTPRDEEADPSPWAVDALPPEGFPQGPWPALGCRDEATGRGARAEAKLHPRIVNKVARAVPQPRAAAPPARDPRRAEPAASALHPLAPVAAQGVPMRSISEFPISVAAEHYQVPPDRALYPHPFGEVSPWDGQQFRCSVKNSFLHFSDGHQHQDRRVHGHREGGLLAALQLGSEPLPGRAHGRLAQAQPRAPHRAGAAGDPPTGTRSTPSCGHSTLTGARPGACRRSRRGCSPRTPREITSPPAGPWRQPWQPRASSEPQSEPRSGSRFGSLNSDCRGEVLQYRLLSSVGLAVLARIGLPALACLHSRWGAGRAARCQGVLLAASRQLRATRSQGKPIRTCTA